jgi:hypothetical protein
VQLANALDYISSLPSPAEFGQFAKDIDPEWIEQALAATGTATFRKRRLPAEQVIWIVIGMALYRNRPISEIVNKLDLAMPSPTHPAVAASAIVQARDRLTEAPMAWLFGRTGDVWAHGKAAKDQWRGLALYSVDGTTLRVPDSIENREHFGLAGGPRAASGFPTVRLASLMALRSHLLAAASFGPYSHGEHWYAKDLWPCVPDNSLVIVDRGFFAAPVLIPLGREGTNRHWLVRGKRDLACKRIKKLGKNDELVELNVSGHAQRQDRSLPKTWTMRLIRYKRKGFEPQILLTSLLDEEQYPAKEIVALYHERWEIELGYDEIKTEMLDNVPLRSKSVDGVRQEIWGLLIAYNLIRLEITRVAEEAQVPPTRISFVGVFRMICDEWLWCAIAKPGAIPRHLRDLRKQIARFVLPPRRSERSYPRAVKVKMSNYRKKRRAHTTAARKRSG